MLPLLMLAMSVPWKDITRGAVGGTRDIATSLGGALLLKEFVLDARYIPSESMLPTFAVGDLLLLDKVSHYWRRPTRGDVICFKAPPELVAIIPALGRGKNVCCIKRVVAVAGDEVCVRRGCLVVNGQVQAEPYRSSERIRYRMSTVRVPPGHYFVLGDNRERSVDSHCWGPLAESHLIGMPLCTYWPPSRVRARGAYRGAPVERSPLRSLREFVARREQSLCPSM